MKKLALTLFFLAALTMGFNASAQRKDSGYEVGNFLINGGISVGDFYYDYGYGSAFPSIIANAEWSVHEWVGVGPYIGVHPLTYGSKIAVGARGTFHYTQFIPAIDPNMLDLYGTLHLGVNIRNYNYNTPGRADDKGITNFVFGPVAGARWFPTQGGFGVFGEVGYGPLGFLTLGVSGKF